MDPYAAATSWLLFGGVVAFGCWYYYPREQQRRPTRHVEDAQHAAATSRRKRHEADERGRTGKRIAAAAAAGEGGETLTTESTPPAPESASANTGNAAGLRKRKAPSEAAPVVVVQADEPEEAEDVHTKKWAEGMMLAQKGHEIGSTKSKETRVKTVKQSSALHTPILSSGSSQAGAEADDDLSPVSSPAFGAAGDVSDMLEPTAKGPKSLRVTAPSKPQREKVARPVKEEIVETKKQRQNRKRAEERKTLRDGDEQERKKLEESQRRTAREARGEPAKNGIPVSKPPAVSAWVSSTSTNDAPFVNGSQNAPLLDTFDAESQSSSNGGLGTSTRPTSTTSGGAAQWDHDLPSEEEQMAQAMKQSEDESGWTTVAQQKKPKKKIDTPYADAVVNNKPAPPTAKAAATNGKPLGFQALEVQYEQRTDADPSDASNWDA